MDDFKENIKAAREAALLNDYDTSLIYYQAEMNTFVWRICWILKYFFTFFSIFE